MLINLLYNIFQIAFFVGVLLNEICNTVLKHLLQEPRPLARNTNLLYSEYGMPSAHSQFMWFFASYMLYFTFIRFVYNILLIVIVFFIIWLLILLKSFYCHHQFLLLFSILSYLSLFLYPTVFFRWLSLQNCFIYVILIFPNCVSVIEFFIL